LNFELLRICVIAFLLFAFSGIQITLHIGHYGPPYLFVLMGLRNIALIGAPTHLRVFPPSPTASEPTHYPIASNQPSPLHSPPYHSPQCSPRRASSRRGRRQPTPLGLCFPGPIHSREEVQDIQRFPNPIIHLHSSWRLSVYGRDQD